MKTTWRVIVFPDLEKRLWVAQCLEYDFSAQVPFEAKIVPFHKLKEAFARTARANAELAIKLSREPFEDFPEAPAKFFKMFEMGEQLLKPFTIEIPWPNRVDEEETAQFALADAA